MLLADAVASGIWILDQLPAGRAAAVLVRAVTERCPNGGEIGHRRRKK
jgi:hypothetical protein